MLTIDGKLFFSNPHSSGMETRTNMSLQMSTDGGSSWKLKPINRPNRNDEYSALTRLGEPGMVGVLWETGGPIGVSSTKAMTINFAKVDISRSSSTS